jgi:hypothetical protein
VPSTSVGASPRKRKRTASTRWKGGDEGSPAAPASEDDENTARAEGKKRRSKATNKLSSNAVHSEEADDVEREEERVGAEDVVPKRALTNKPKSPCYCTREGTAKTSTGFQCDKCSCCPVCRKQVDVKAPHLLPSVKCIFTTNASLATTGRSRTSVAGAALRAEACIFHSGHRYWHRSYSK